MDASIQDHLNFLEKKIEQQRSKIEAHMGQHRGMGVLEETYDEWNREATKLGIELKVLCELHQDFSRMKKSR